MGSALYGERDIIFLEKKDDGTFELRAVDGAGCDKLRGGSRYRPARPLTESMRYGAGPVATPCSVSAMSFSARAQKFPDKPGARLANSLEVSGTKKHKIFLEKNPMKTGENYSFDRKSSMSASTTATVEVATPPPRLQRRGGGGLGRGRGDE